MSIGTIILIVWRGLNRRWHERWLNYRALAEMLRHGRFLAYVLEGVSGGKPLYIVLNAAPEAIPHRSRRALVRPRQWPRA